MARSIKRNKKCPPLHAVAPSSCLILLAVFWALLSSLLVTTTSARKLNSFVIMSDNNGIAALAQLRGGGSSSGAGVPVDAAVGGGDSSSSSLSSIRVAYQGEPGAYSEKATRELLGEKVVAVGRQSFEACFRAVANMECDYACLPIENSLGGSIHENYDLMLRYDLKIVAEHEFRVKHCLMAKPGVKRDAIKYAISHPQALAQCDNFLRGLGITPIPTYDTAGSAKMISEGGKLPPNCTPENTAAIASDLAAKTYGLNCLDVGIEDDDTNFTRFLLLSRKAVHDAINSKLTPAKTSVVFTLHDTPGALYKALACFSLRDIDFSKIESRPTSASLLNFIKFKSQKMGSASRNQADLPRFRYCFYLDFLASQLDGKAKNALAHLNEQADYVRILGSYPQKSKLVGDVARSVEELKRMVDGPNKENLSISSLPSDEEDTKPLSIGLVGFDEFSQLLAKRFMEKHRVSCLDLKYDHTAVAKKLGVEYFSSFETSKFLSNVDVVVICVPLVDFEDTVAALPVTSLKGKLVVETCVLNSHPKSVLLRAFGKHADIDIISSHIMVGPHGGDENSIVAESSWDGRPMVYEKVRIANFARCEKYLKIFEEARCQIVEMSAEKHDASIADAEFVTHLTGRLLIDKQLLPPTPVLSKEYAALCDVADMTAGDSFDLFFGMFKFNDRARGHLTKMRDNLAALEQRLAAKEAYLAASIELRNNDRQRLIAETKLLLQEVVKNGVMQENDGNEEEKVMDNAQKQLQQPTTTNDVPKK